MRGPCNWCACLPIPSPTPSPSTVPLIPSNRYRTRRTNFEAERSLPSSQRQGVQQPVLFIFATGDSILSEDLQKGMDKAIPNLTKRSVPASHWALWHTPTQTNEAIKGWVEGVVFGRSAKL